MTKHIDDDKARELFKAKVPNIEAARILGVRSPTIPKIKRRLGFEVNGVRKGCGKRSSRSYAEQLRLALKFGNPVPVFVPRRPSTPKSKPRPAANSQPRAVPKVRPESPPWDGESVSLLKLKPSQCAWIVKPGAYPVIAECCGDNVDYGSGRPLCARHRALSKGRTAQEAA